MREVAQLHQKRGRRHRRLSETKGATDHSGGARAPTTRQHLRRAVLVHDYVLCSDVPEHDAVGVHVLQTAGDGTHVELGDGTRDASERTE